MNQTVRRWVAAALLVVLPLAAKAQASGAVGQAAAPSAGRAVRPDAPPKVLRYAFPAAETGFDPAQINDLYSRTVTAHIFDAPLSYDPLARPFKLKPSTAQGMPEVSDDFKTFVFHLRPGIHFADDPAFKGKKRELVAQDYVYAIKRIYDPVNKSPAQSNLEEEGIVGLQALRDEALAAKKPFDYDREVEGLRALDRYTLRVKLRQSRPRHLYTWAARDLYGAVAREVVEAYGDKIMEHPVGTGPFMLTEWRRSSRMVLQRNPNYRDDFYDAEPNADDAAGQALLQRFKGRRLPMIDRVELDVIDEAQPRWLAFLNGEHDFLERLANEFVNQATPGGKVSPQLARRGISALKTPAADIYFYMFNMDDPLVGGYTADKVALRRAMVLGNDQAREIELARRGQAIAAQSILPPFTSGYQADIRTESSAFSPARAKALLDLYGYTDRDGDGWRERPDGHPLVLELMAQSDLSSRQLDELWAKDMKAIGLKVVLKIGQWPENLKAARAGKYMLWRVGSSASSPDGQGALERAYGPSTGKGNFARFKLPAFDRVYDHLKEVPDGPERQALFNEATKLLVAYAPMRLSVHRLLTDLNYPWLVGYQRPPFWQDWWQYVDIDESQRPAR